MQQVQLIQGLDGPISIIAVKRTTTKDLQDYLVRSDQIKRVRYIDDDHQPYFVVQS